MFNAQYFRTFITLVETGSFTQTAKQLSMTQPGVSQHIRKLERYLQKSLLNRHGRSFTLTESGRRAYDYALKLFAEHEQFREDARGHFAALRGSLDTLERRTFDIATGTTAEG